MRLAGEVEQEESKVPNGWPRICDDSAWMEVARHPDRFTDIELGHELFIAKHGSFEATYLNCEPKGAGGIFERVPRDLGTREAKDAEAVATADVWRSVLRQGKGYGGQSKGQTAS